MCRRTEKEITHKLTKKSSHGRLGKDATLTLTNHKATLHKRLQPGITTDLHAFRRVQSLNKLDLRPLYCVLSPPTKEQNEENLEHTLPQFVVLTWSHGSPEGSPTMHLVQSLDCWSCSKSDESAVFSVEDSSW